MVKLGTHHFYPERIIWIGAPVLILGSFVCFFFLFSLYKTGVSSSCLREKERSEPTVEFYTFSLGLSDKGPVMPIPEIQGEMTFSFDPPRPSGAAGGKRLLVRMKKSAESKRVVLPCRVDLEFQGDRLVFAKEKSPFWAELSLRADGEIEGKGFITSLEGEKMEVGDFLATGQEAPIQTAQEFREGSAFRILAEARWWGRDLFREHGGERLEIGTACSLLELNEGDWLVWRDQKWEKSPDFSDETHTPIAHIQSRSGKALVLEGWDSDGYIRLALESAVGPVFKVRGEDLFSSVRIRSEKQMSCMLEKQCMVLKTGDWVLKTGGRWKVLRKKEERDALLHGKLFGELFIFEQISQKQGQKVIQGKLFNPGRTQVIAIEMAAQSARKMGERARR